MHDPRYTGLSDRLQPLFVSTTQFWCVKLLSLTLEIFAPNMSKFVFALSSQTYSAAMATGEIHAIIADANNCFILDFLLLPTEEVDDL